MARRLKRLGIVAGIVLVLAGCARDTGDGFFYRTWKHIQWHILGAYKDFVELHKEVDRYFFNLDERNPDRY